MLYFGSSHQNAVAVTLGTSLKPHHAASHPGQGFSGSYQSLRVNAMTTSFEIHIYSMFVISFTSFSAFCSWNGVNSWSGNASFPFVGHLIYLWIVGCSYIHVQLWWHDCFLLRILLGKQEIWKLECYVSTENWPGNCAVEMLAWREDISISPPPPLFVSSFSLSSSQSRNNSLGLGPYCWDSELIRSTFLQVLISISSIYYIIKKTLIFKRRCWNSLFDHKVAY